MGQRAYPFLLRSSVTTPGLQVAAASLGMRSALLDACVQRLNRSSTLRRYVEGESKQETEAKAIYIGLV